MKVGLKNDLLKSEFEHIQNDFLCNKLIEISLGFYNKAFKNGFFIFSFPKPLDMSSRQEFQYNIRFFAIWLFVDDNFFSREVKIKVFFSS